MRLLSVGLLAAACVCTAGAMHLQAARADSDDARYNIPAGSYRESCMNVQVRGDDLYARCQDINGNWHPTQLDMDQCPGRMVSNNNGTLVCGPGGARISNRMPLGSWRASCRNAGRDGDDITAECATAGGGWRRTSIDMGDCPSRLLGNADGRLVCENGYGYRYGGGGLPSGSWRQSCRNASLYGNVLYAECDTGYGSWRQVSFDLRRCPGGPIGNDHGNLFCQRQQIYRPH